jgi:hypothetical protein
VKLNRVAFAALPLFLALSPRPAAHAQFITPRMHADFEAIRGETEADVARSNWLLSLPSDAALSAALHQRFAAIDQQSRMIANSGLRRAWAQPTPPAPAAAGAPPTAFGPTWTAHAIRRR